MRKLCFAFLMMITLTGCGSTGTYIKNSNVSAIQRGVTTKQEIVGMFGQPADSAITPKGLTYTYQYTESSLTAVDFVPVVSLFYQQMKEKHETLLVVFDNNDIVKDYSFVKSNDFRSTLPSAEQTATDTQAQAEATQPSAQFNAAYEDTYRATTRALVDSGYTIENSDATAGSITAKQKYYDDATNQEYSNTLSALVNKINGNLTEVQITGSLNHKILFDKIGVILSGRQ